MMKERFAKLLLGEDMSGGGKGVCPALAISNAITNLCGKNLNEIWPFCRILCLYFCCLKYFRINIFFVCVVLKGDNLHTFDLLCV